MYSKRIDFLESSLKLIEERILKDTNTPIDLLKEEKTKYQKELSTLRRLQWEHDHETVSFDDDDR